VHIDDVRYDGITGITGADIAYAQELGLSLKLIGTAERLPHGLSVRVHPTFIAAGHPLAAVNGSFNAVTVEAEAITEITMSGPGAGGSQTASAVLGDVVAAIAGAPPASPPLERLEIVEDVTSAFYVHMEVDDRPGVLAQIAGILGEAGASIRSVVQRGTGERAQLTMVIHPLARSLLEPALVAIGELEFVRSSPRAISVIDEEFE
jgi:homoserine dehydrogenase